MKYFIRTYGCQMNHSDSERIAGVLELANYEKSSQESDADLIVINMCSVRESAVSRISGNFHKYKKYIITNPNLKTVITGCVLDSDKEKFGELFDLVIDIREIEKLPERLKSMSTNKILPEFKTSQPSLSGGTKSSSSNQKSMIFRKARNDKEKLEIENTYDYFSINPQHESKITAYVPIMTGCNNFCSYCVVPYTRGREKSRMVDEIIDEIAKLIENGYKEIILLGQNVNSYQPDENTNFPKLLRLINDIPGHFWIRFLTSHPKDISEELIKTVALCEKCTEYIHLALQSGDDDILKIMNRKYTAEHFLILVQMIRKNISNVAITTDIIVGFPTETIEQLQNTAEIMKKIKFDMAYINKYSPREGTVSAKMTDNVSWDEKKEREVILNKILKETALENNQKYVGKVVEVLVDKIDGDFIFGKTKSFKSVKIGIINYKSRIKEGEFLKVKITEAEFWNLEGEVVE
ncbi:MAG: tRNA (N6-isopentenyl adenosine(37)-C2)-methylthiotransferase MiaB [Candidatus Pacebacteria bacterium]|nr:tRNA (N6-isopentenyl adenosine(37)-C2)-methylthiotransferase MiaB [Candidatus Paceibacterota bacterium]